MEKHQIQKPPLNTPAKLAKRKQRVLPFDQQRKVVHKRTISNTPREFLEASQERTLRVSHRRTLSEEFVVNSEEKLNLLSEIKSSFASSGRAPLTTLGYYKIGRELGKGAFGSVYSGVHILTGLKVAIKIIDKQRLKDHRAKVKVEQEIFVQNRIRHKNISQFIESFETTESIYIVMEYVGGGNLLDMLKRRGPLPENEAKFLMRRIVTAVQACHSKNIAHRDIKLDNILLTSDGRDIKICDFGISRMMQPGEHSLEQCGTPAYLAPEIVLNEGYQPFFVDVWSMGVMMYAIVTGKFPFMAKSSEELKKTIVNCQAKFPSCLSEECKDLLAKMICKSPELRIRLDRIQAHPWFFTTEDASRSPTRLREDENQTASLVCQLGFTEEFLIQSLRFKEINHATATYHLLKLFNDNKLHFV